MSSNEKISAFLVLDIIGRPAGYLLESLKKLTEEMKKEGGVTVKSINIKEPVAMKESKDFFTTFAEIEVETENMMYLASLMFKYMPAHVQVISPENITLPNTDWSEILSELTRRLHSYDEVARVIQAERTMLLKKMQDKGIDIKSLMPDKFKEKKKSVKEK